MEAIATDDPIAVLDFGCGGSPYRSLFPNADYRRADVSTGDDAAELDYILCASEKLDEADEVFDLVLSTQVLEHVDDPLAYLRECYRLLREGGALYLTTHGTYPDHGCPADYYRWTADGLVKDLKSVGFEIERTEKQTVGPRAFFLSFDYQLQNLNASRRTAFGAGLYLLSRIFERLRPWVHRMCDQHFAHYRIVKEGLENHPVYAVAACLARKRTT